MTFQELDHTADWALQIKGATTSQLFQKAALGMFELMGVTLMEDNGLERHLELEAFDLEELLVAWLEELLHGIEMRSVGVSDLNVTLGDNASLQAEFVEVPIQSIEKEIKGVTFHALEIKENSEGVEAIVVFDV